MANLYTLERAKWTTEKRKQYLKDHPENHAGPNGSFPIEDGSDVEDAWGLAGHAADPDAVRAKIKAIAKRLGLTASLPDTAKEDNSSEERMMGTHTHTDEALTRAASANHEPFTGTHSHSHDANGAQGDDATHEHSHSHDNDNNHDHSHSEDRALPDAILDLTGYAPHLSFPIVRSDPKTWAVYGRATAEIPDRHGTIFSYEGAKGAFERWPGNVREQHDGKRAVGHRIKHTFNDEEKGVYLEAGISRTRPDTWERVMDNTLNDFSVSVIPAEKYGLDPRKWPRKEYNGKMYPYLPEYDYSEISLVDAGSAPGSHFTPIMRADGTATDVLAIEEETPAVVSPELPAASSTESLDRAGARLSADSRAALHDMRDKAMALCGCDECQGMQPGEEDDGDEDMERKLSGLIERVLEAKLHAVYARLQGIAGTIARSYAAPTEASLNTLITGTIERAVQSATAVNESSLAEVRASQEAVKEQVGSIAKQVADIANTPVPGAPVMNAGALSPRPVDKRLATDPPLPARHSEGALYDAIAQAWATGRLDTIDKQTNAMAAGLVAQRRG